MNSLRYKQSYSKYLFLISKEFTSHDSAGNQVYRDKDDTCKTIQKQRQNVNKSNGKQLFERKQVDMTKTTLNDRQLQNVSKNESLY